MVSSYIQPFQLSILCFFTLLNPPQKKKKNAPRRCEKKEFETYRARGDSEITPPQNSPKPGAALEN